MAEQVIISQDADRTFAIGQALGRHLSPGTNISLRGPLGAGKTILVKGIASSLGITEPITSPTYTILQEYSGTMDLYHMDLYRISSVEEFEMLGTEELLYSKGITLIEWSETIDEILPEDTIFVTFVIKSDQDRIITIHGANYEYLSL